MENKVFSYTKDNLIRDGDSAVIIEGGDSIKQVTVTKGGSFHNKFGIFLYDTLIGQVEFGSKIFSKNNTGYVIILRPNSHIYT